MRVVTFSEARNNLKTVFDQVSDMLIIRSLRVVESKMR